MHGKSRTGYWTPQVKVRFLVRDRCQSLKNASVTETPSTLTMPVPSITLT